MVAEHVKRYGGPPRPDDRGGEGDGVDGVPPPTFGWQAASGERIATQADGKPDQTLTYAPWVATPRSSRFQVLRPHARGGLGLVSIALDAELNREVALKQILGQHADDPASRHRFLLEAEITGGLEHPGIVPVYGLGHDAEGRPFYAMRFVKGESLKEAIAAFHGAADRSVSADSGRWNAGPASVARPVHRRLPRDRLRPQPWGPAPRPEAVEHPARAVRRDTGRRLGPGEGGGTRRHPRVGLGRADAEDRADLGFGLGKQRNPAGHGGRDSCLHEPRTGRRATRSDRAGERRLQPGRHALRAS